MKKNYTVADYLAAIDSFAPFSLAENWDNVGLLIGSPGQEVNRARVAMDATIGVMDRGVDLLVTHHPIIFHPLKSVIADSPVYQIIKRGAAVISAHTNLDIAVGGVNDVLARLLGLREVEVLKPIKTKPYLKVAVYTPVESVEQVYRAMVDAGGGQMGSYTGAGFISGGQGRFTPAPGANPTVGEIGRPEQVDEKKIEMLVPPERIYTIVAAIKASHPYEQPAFDIIETHSANRQQGLGRVGKLPAQLTVKQLAELVRERLGAAAVKFFDPYTAVTSVAVCGGAGGSLLLDAYRMGAQVLVTSEVKQSELVEAERLGMGLIDAGHYHTEAVILPVLAEKLKTALPGADIEVAPHYSQPGWEIV